EVTALTLPGFEADQIQAALVAAEGEVGVPMPHLQTRTLAPKSRPQCSHLWLVSVVNDPEAFPALHDELYGRRGTREATGRGNIHKERKQALALFEAGLSWLHRPACITTSQEELPILDKALGDSAKNLLIPVKARLSPIVGDPIVHCNWSA
ncbi:MAG: hypothetical protein KDB61_15120, partial [Planctomycetes bacterium]|nr:hypothetical protein [Planctomycetota bacterium]